MKSLAINLAAIWAATLETFQDGNVFRESNIDLQMLSIGDRLGYLKTAVDGKASLSTNNTWTGVQTFKPSGGGGQVAATFWRSLQFVTRGTDAVESLIAGVVNRIERFNGAANETVTIASEYLLIPTTTGNRQYSLNPPSPSLNGRVIRITRPRTGDAHTCEILDVLAGTTLCIFPASQTGWVDLMFDGASASGSWVVVARSVNLTSVSVNV